MYIKFMQLIKILADNPLLTLTSIIFGIITGILGMKAYSIKPKKIRRYLNIISDSIGNYNKISVLYDGEIIESFSKTEFFFWNSGKKTLRDNDLLLEYPLGIYFKEGIKIYQLEYITTDRIKDFFNLYFNEQKNFFKIGLRSMVKNDGIFVRIYHSGEEDGVKKIKKQIDFDDDSNNDFDDDFDVKRLLLKAFAKTMIKIVLPMNAFAFFCFLLIEYISSNYKPIDTIAVTLTVIVVVIYGGIIVAYILDRKGIPKELRQNSKAVYKFKILDITKKSFNPFEPKALEEECFLEE